MQWSHLTAEIINNLIDQQVLGHSPVDICQQDGLAQGVTLSPEGVACSSCAFHGPASAFGMPHIRQAPHYCTQWREARILIAELARKGWEITLAYKGLRLHVTVRRPYMAAWQTADFRSQEPDATVVCHAILKVAGIVED